MPTCHGCGGEFEAADLVHHERDGVHVVHCPDCGCTLGSYNEHRR
ncbi:hypothetical protein [Halobacterium yunchengense]